MKILNCSTVDINCLKGALLINEKDHEFYCVGIGFSLDDGKIYLDLIEADTKESAGSVDYEDVSKWSIQLGSSLLNMC